MTSPGTRRGRRLRVLLGLAVGLPAVTALLVGGLTLALLTDAAVTSAAVRRALNVVVPVALAGTLLSLLVAGAAARRLWRATGEVEIGLDRLLDGHLDHRLSPGDDELAPLREAVNTLAARLEAARSAVEERGVRDGLTGLSTERELRRRLEEELARSRRYGHELVVLVVSAAGLADLTAAHGPATADRALKAVADALADTLRPVDILGRYGETAVAVLLPETPREAVPAVVSRLRDAVAATALPLPDGATERLTLAVGSAAHPADGTVADHLLTAAEGSARTGSGPGGRAAQSSPPKSQDPRE